MSITSLTFFLILLLVLAVYYLLPRRAQNYWLLAVSYAFYTTWSWQFSLVLLTVTAANYLLAHWIEKTGGRMRIQGLWLGILVNLAVLVFFRTVEFFLPEFIELLASLGMAAPGFAVQIFLPIGLAFTVLQTISYLVDVHRGQTAASTSPLDFALYLAYFPKLLSGPIERARTFLPLLAAQRRVDNRRLASSLTLILLGLLRKLFFAGTLSAIIFWDAFEFPGRYSALELIGWIALYGLFLYNDFAGYTNLARGISGLFGIELSQNFQQPYFARSMTEFWNSWHISLSHWLRDYIFFPLTRALMRRFPNRAGWQNIAIPPMATMLISGLWHGLNAHMLLWGGMHGVYQVIERAASIGRPASAPQRWRWWRQALAMVITGVLVTLAWVPFVMPLPIAFAYWGGMLNWAEPAMRYRRILLFFPFLALTLTIDWLQRRYGEEDALLRWPRLVQASVVAASLFLIILLMQSEREAPFVYQGF